MNRKDWQAFGKECLVCHKKNHFAKVCDKRNMKANYVRMAGDTTASVSSDSEEDISDTKYFTDDEPSHLSAVSSLDFRRGHFRGLQR